MARRSTVSRVEVDVLVCGMGPVSESNPSYFLRLRSFRRLQHLFISLTPPKTGLGAAKRLHQIVCASSCYTFDATNSLSLRTDRLGLLLIVQINLVVRIRKLEELDGALTRFTGLAGTDVTPEGFLYDVGG